MNTFGQSCFLKRMREVTPVSDETAALLAEYLTECCFEKRDIVLKAGYFCKYVWLIESGMVRHYWMVDGNEIVTSFSLEGQVIFSMDELYFGKKSQEYAQAVEPIEAYRISVKDMNRLLSTNLELCNWGAPHSPVRIPTNPSVAQRAPDLGGKGPLPGVYSRIP